MPLLDVERIDDDLSRAARDGNTMRLRLGALLDAVARRGIHHEMGFSSLEAYALEWCERSSRWIQESRHVARSLDALPELRAALVAGEMPFSTACLVAGRATPGDEQAWLAATQTLTVRQLRALLTERMPDADLICHGILFDDLDEPVAREPGARRGAIGAEPDGGATRTAARDEVRVRTLEIIVDREDAWLFECARMIARRLSHAPSAEEVFDVLLAEAGTTFPRATAAEIFSDAEANACDARQAWERQLEAWRDEAEARCERRFASARCTAPKVDVPAASDLEDMTPSQLHTLVRDGARELLLRDLTIGRLAERFWAAGGWRRLGYATACQYARERLGLRISCVKNKRALARGSSELPQVAEALAGGAIGSEAARLITSVSDTRTCEAWIARARCRTVKHLREEVSVASMIARLQGSQTAPPPSEEELYAMHQIESAVVSGAWLRAPGCANGAGAGVAIQERSASDPGIRTVIHGQISEQRGALAQVGQMSAGGVAAAVGGAAAMDGQLSAGGSTAAMGGQMSAGGVAAATGGQMSAGGSTAAMGGQMSAGGSTAAMGGQMSAGCPDEDRAATLCTALFRLAPQPKPGSRTGRVTLRFRVSAATLRIYRRMEGVFRRDAPGRVPFLRFLCLSFIQTWKHALPSAVAYGHIYERDRFRCQSPVCSRSDVTPHHLRYRSQGGDDSDENVISLCVWCHLEGIHGGRLRAAPPASSVLWQVGRDPEFNVTGRLRTRDV